MFFARRPKLAALPVTRAERVAEVVCGVLLGAFVLFAAVVAPRLPELDPVQVYATACPGAPASWEGLLTAAAFSAFAYLLLSVVQRHPSLHRYTFHVTPEKAPAVYRVTRQNVLAMKLLVTLTVPAIFVAPVSCSLDGPELQSPWLSAAILLSYPAAALIGVVRLRRVRAGTPPLSSIDGG